MLTEAQDQNVDRLDSLRDLLEPRTRNTCGLGNTIILPFKDAQRGVTTSEDSYLRTPTSGSVTMISPNPILARFRLKLGIASRSQSQYLICVSAERLIQGAASWHIYCNPTPPAWQYCQEACATDHARANQSSSVAHSMFAIVHTLTSALSAVSLRP